LIYGRSVKTTKVDVVRVNSKQRQKKDDKYFRELVADCIKLLEKNGKAICFDKDQLEEIKKVLAIEAKYNNLNNWWELTYDKKRKTKTSRL
jgi:hypothetical protein